MREPTAPTHVSVQDLAVRVVQRALEADDLHHEIMDHPGVSDARAIDLDRVSASARATVATLISAVQTALAVEAAERDAHPLLYLGDEEDADDGPEPERDDGPHALACRFTASLVGSIIGNIGGRPMMFVPYTGWVDITDFSEADEPEGEGGPATVVLRGRAISRYNDRVLCITDSGVGMVLPVAAVTLEADE